MTKKEIKSCIETINWLRKVDIDEFGAIEEKDNDNCNKIIAMLESKKKAKFSKKDSAKVLTLMKKELAQKGTVTEKALEIAIEALSKK